jgi:hypothetical protein
MKVTVISLILSFSAVAPALGGPGDLTLIQGKLEWPSAMSGSEPFIVVRGDDGHAYYADVVAARRYVQGTLSAGSQTALLGLEGLKPHEIVAIALGSGNAMALSLAIAEAGPTPSRPPAASEQPPPGPGERLPAQGGEGYWHYCKRAKAYYPDRAELPGPVDSRGPEGARELTPTAAESGPTRLRLA